MDDSVHKGLSSSTFLKNIGRNYIETSLSFPSIIKAQQDMLNSLDMFHSENSFDKEYLDIN